MSCRASIQGLRHVRGNPLEFHTLSLRDAFLQRCFKFGESINAACAGGRFLVTLNERNHACLVQAIGDAGGTCGYRSHAMG